MTPVESYLADLSAVRGAGTAETSGYPALANLLNEVGGLLKPKITAVIHPANSGAGLPDGGFFSAKELRQHPDEVSLLKLNPERGVLEVKPVEHDLLTLAQTAQVRNYLEHYGQILLTNYRSFALYTWEGGKPTAGETFYLAESESAFWNIARNAKDHRVLGERLLEYLRRVLLNRARLAAPKDLAAYLASYAREARARVEGAPVNTLAPISEALGEALGIRFEGEKGAHFFRSTLIQTLFYGIFSAWVLWNEDNPKPTDRFQWRLSQYHLGLPVLRTLFHQLADAQKLRDLGLEEVLDWTESTLARVERAAFFQRIALGEAVQYFYEPFLSEFDPELRKQFGVWYTPPEIVQYMVARVDRALQENYGIPDGLADPRVVVLDPCCGTGAYLVETLRTIYGRLKEGAGEAQAALQTKIAAQTRLFGFELLPAPYVIAHLQIDLQLARFGAPMQHEPEKAKKGEKHKAGERASVFLTNALTGWVPPEEPKTLLFPELAAERDAADRVKRTENIIVIIGNPPYDGHPGLAVGEERGLVDAYKASKRAAKPEGRGRNELYMRFWRMAERRIIEGPPEDENSPELRPPRKGTQGIICFITNYSWLNGRSHSAMRERFLEAFDRVTIDCMNGDKRETGKTTPEGLPDPSLFSSEHNREGIQVGTAISIVERWPVKKRQQTTTNAQVRFRNFWGKTKRADLLASLSDNTGAYQTVEPTLPRLILRPYTVALGYDDWSGINQLFAEKFSGVQTSRDDDLVAFNLEDLVRRIAAFLDTDTSLDELRISCPTLLRSSTDYDPAKTRKRLAAMQKTLSETRETPSVNGIAIGRFVRFAYRPLDVRWLFWEGETELLHRPSPDLIQHVFAGNVFLATQTMTRGDWYSPQVISCLGCLDLLDRGASLFPLYLAQNNQRFGATCVVRETPDMFGDQGGSDDSHPMPNLTPLARDYLAKLNMEPEDLFYHVVALLHSPAYRMANAGALQQDWPRVPLPLTSNTLRSGAETGRQIAALLNPETDVPGVTAGTIHSELRGLAELTVTADAKPKTADLAMVARWGYRDKKRNVMPGPGDMRPGTRGDGFVDVQLNATTRWKDVPQAVWDYTLGGYQVLKKWLSYREATLLGRPLTADEALDFTNNVRRIAALLALHPQLDAHYDATANQAPVSE